MIWSVVIGILILGGFGVLQNAWQHEGSGVVTYENGDTTKVSESQYKRNQYAMGGMMLVIGIILWVVIANGERKGVKEK